MEVETWFNGVLEFTEYLILTESSVLQAPKASLILRIG